MKRKTVIITIVLLITISLIVILKYYIKKDTIRTQKERLNFFTENLSIQKNTLLNSFQNYSTLVVEGINNDQQLLSLLETLSIRSSTDQRQETIKSISQQSSNYFQLLSNIGFTSLMYSFKTGTNEVFRFSIKSEPITHNSTLLQQEYFPTFNKVPLSSYDFSKTTVEYMFSYPLPLNNSKRNPKAKYTQQQCGLFMGWR